MPEYRSDMTVKLVQHLGDETMIMNAAKVSTLAGHAFDEEAEQKDPARFVRWLLREGHGSPFEHNLLTFYFEVPVFISRQIVKYRHSCLAGDTKIYFESSNGNVYWKTIADHWEDWHNGIKTESKSGTPFRRHLPSVRNATVRSINEKTLRKELSSVNDVVKSGEKEVFEVHSTSGQSVTASADHLFYTPKGWRRLKEMQVGDEVYFQGRGFPGVTPETRAVPNGLRVAICAWSRSKLAYLQERDGMACAKCSTIPDTYTVDHVVPVAADIEKALLVSNLQLLCLDCDREKTSREQALRDSSRMSPVAVRAEAITSIESRGVQMTYDLCLDAPHHNFFANGYVVHNSINEVSGRYSVLDTTFYVPDSQRPLVQYGKPGDYTFEDGGADLRFESVGELKNVTIEASARYKYLLDSGVAREVARMCLPVNIYSQMVVSANLRSWLHFVAQRANEAPSHGQYEIAMVADQVGLYIQELFPNVWQEFVEGGYQRV